MIVKIKFQNTKTGQILTYNFEDGISPKRTWKQGYILFCRLHEECKPIEAWSAGFEPMSLENL